MPKSSIQTVLPSPNLSWRDGQPISTQFNDPYFSIENGLAETRYVFLKHNGLPDRWHEWDWSQPTSFNIIETGFGTGLNFLATWQLWREYLATQKTSSAWLHFTSIEKYPLTKEQLQQSLALWPELADLAEKLLTDFPLPLQGPHQLSWPEEKISLTLWFNDIKEALPNISAPVHAWLLDGFAPSRNPEMWNDSLFQWIRKVSQNSDFNTAHSIPTFATFTAAGLVRRGLMGAGFKVKKAPGFGRKRDMIHGHFNFSQGPEQPHYCWQKPWLTEPQQTSQSIAIIGAGLAGCFTARALAERGVNITIFDHNGIATQASGNAQGGIYIKLNAGDSALLSNFYLAGYQHALRKFKYYLGESDAQNLDWQQCGLIQLAFDEKEQLRQQKFLESNNFPHELLHPISAQQASEIADSELEQGGLFYPQSGWISPSALCQTLLDHPKIHFKKSKVNKIQKNTSGWQVFTDESIQIADQVVIANANQASELLPELYLPLKNIRGQLSYIDSNQAPNIKTVLSGQCYIAPAKDSQMSLGATFDIEDNDSALRDSDHLRNLEQVSGFGKQWQPLANAGLNAIVSGKVGFRCAAPDYLPMVGAVPDEEHFLKHFHALIKDSKATPRIEHKAVPGLWLNIAHGAKGLVSAPICAELLAHKITGSGAPFGKDIIEALWPGRFLLKDMVRRKLPDRYQSKLRI